MSKRLSYPERFVVKSLVSTSCFQWQFCTTVNADTDISTKECPHLLVWLNTRACGTLASLPCSVWLPSHSGQLPNAEQPQPVHLPAVSQQSGGDQWNFKSEFESKL